MRQITRVLAKDKIAAELRHEILYGSYTANQELSYDKIATELGVSTTPVREAVQMLVSEGLVMARPNRAPIVLNISDEFIRDYFDIRALLEQEAIGRAAAYSSDCTELFKYHSLADKAVLDEDYDTYNDYNMLIHSVIWELSCSKKLAQILSQMRQTIHVTDYAKENAARSNREHAEMIHCILEREPERARKIMKSHVQNNLNILLEIKNSRR